jgi:hypothetical protein
MTVQALPGARFIQKLALRIAGFAGIDAPLALGVSVRVWALVAGLVTLTFVMRHLSPRAQGYYFAFGSLSQLTSLVDLGLQVLVLQFASHEAAHLTFGRGGAISGPPRAVERLVSLARFSLAWFGILSLVLIPAMFGIGYWLFSARTDQLPWKLPWELLCVLVAIDLVLNNFVWLLEGTNQLSLNYAYRLLRGVVTPLALWIGLGFGWGLMAIPLSVFMGVVSLLTFLAITSSGFVLSFFRVRPEVHRLSWRREILPLQWRLGVSMIGGFVSSSLFVPVAFKFIGPTAAGQVGLTWTLVEAMTGVAAMWLAVRFPMMGAMVAKQAWEQLDKVSLTVTIRATALATLGATVIVSFAYMLHVSQSRYAMRLLPLLPLSLFAYAAVPKLISSAMIYYLRAHQREPIFLVSALMIPLTLGVTVEGAIWFGPLGIAAGYFLVIVFFQLPAVAYVTARCRAQWHRSPVEGLTE